MVDYTYKLDLDEPVEMGSRFKEEPRKGIGVQPKKEEEPEANGWADMFYGLLQGYFGDEDEAKKALTTEPEKPSYDMDDALQTLKSVNLPSRISEPVIEGAPEKPEMGSREPFELEVDTIGNEALDRSGMRLVDVTDTEEGKLTNEEPLYEMAEEIDPGTIDTEPLDADGGASTGGKGLMSPTTEETTEDTTESSSSFATIIKAGVSETVDVTTPLSSGFDSLTEAEGTDIHLDGRGFVTLPYGIVPDKDSIKKSDGTTFDPTGKHGLTEADLTSVDYSGATKFGVSRSDYDNDQDFAKAVYAEFSKRTATEYGTGFNDLTDAAKQAAYDIAWNAGIGSAGWSSVKTMLQEASKEGTKSKDSLIGFTTNFKSGTDYPRGLLKRRLETYNLVANEGEKASLITTTAVMTDGKRTGTLYTIKDANGGVLKTWTKPDTDEKLGDLEVPQ